MGIKGKGVFAIKAGVDLRHALKANIIAIAVRENLVNHVPLEETINDETDINLFLLTHAATGNFKCFYMGEELGKLVRYYKTSSPFSLHEIVKIDMVSGKNLTVPNGNYATPLMDLPDEMPELLDRQWYIDEARKLLSRIAPAKSTGFNQQAASLMAIGLIPVIVNKAALRRSRAWGGIGTTDFNAMCDGEVLGVCTGPRAGVIACVDIHTGDTVNLWMFSGKLPGKTRKTISQKQGFEIIYGANIPVPPRFVGEHVTELTPGELDYWMATFYTTSELKKCGAIT